MGIRAELRIESPSQCPVTSATKGIAGIGTNIAKTSTSPPSEPVTEEFMLDSDTPVESVQHLEVDTELDEVFSYGSNRTYRFTRPHNNCVCECIERFDCPITDVYAQDGALFVTFHTPDIDQLKTVLVELRGQAAGVTVNRLLRTAKDTTNDDLVLVDRSNLTARQREVLRTAHEMGYFEHGQGANAGDVADALDINTSTFSEHLRAAQRKLLATILDT